MELLASASDQLPYILVASICIGLAILYWLLWRVEPPAGGRRRAPPGPRALPLIGHLHLLGSMPHQSFSRLAQTYGPLMSLRLGAVPLVVASTPAMAMLVLHTHDRSLCGRPPNLSIPRNCFGGPDIVFSSPGPYWRLMRQICATELVTSKRLDYFKPIRTEELALMMRSILAAAATPIPVLHTLQTHTNNVISRMALGKRMQDVLITAGGGADQQQQQQQQAENSAAVMILGDLGRILGAFNVGDFIPCLAWTDLQGHVKQSKHIGRKAKAFFQEVIDTRRKSRKADEPPQHFLDLLLMAALDSKHKELQLQDDHIRAILMDVLAAATDTSAVTSEWALAELLANPEKLNKVQEELDEVVGRSRIFQESDLPNLPYLRVVINETMRLHPAGPLLVPRYALEACEIAGYHIPASTMIYVNAWAIGRDPATWKNPLEFYPERFLDSTIDVLGQHCELIPFGAGRRICAGLRLGLLNVEVSLASLLHAFDWSATTSKPNLNEKFGMVVSLKEPLIATPMPRLPRPIFQEYM